MAGNPNWQPGRSGNPSGKPLQKPFLEALKTEIRQATDENDYRSLRRAARALLKRASQGDTTAIGMLADRLEGKVPQAIVGSDEHPPLITAWLDWMTGLRIAQAAQVLDASAAEPTLIDAQAIDV